MALSNVDLKISYSAVKYCGYVNCRYMFATRKTKNLKFLVSSWISKGFILLLLPHF